MARKKTQEEFLNQVTNIHGIYDYSQTKYLGNHKPVEIICRIHGSFMQQPCHHINGAGCPMCAQIITKNKTTWTLSKFIEQANKLHNNKYVYTEYKGALKKINIICPKHGNFLQSAVLHLQGHGCQKCAGNYRRTTDEFITECNLLHNNYYDYSKVKFEKRMKYVKIICPKHGDFNQLAQIHLSGGGCPKCNTSNGEKEIGIWLDNNKINYIQEYKFDNCKSPKNRKLKFDFYLPDKNLCIEFDGKQHFFPNKFFKNYSFELTQKYDIIKNEYCINNNIHLLRINYTQKNEISEILQQIFITV